MENAGSALMGVGVASGDKRAEEAAQSAINSPLLEVSITGAKGVLFAIAGNDDLGMLEIQDAARAITESIDPHAKVIFGAVRDEKLKKNEVKITVIATGFPEIGAHGTSATSSMPHSEESPDEEPVRGRIFNSLGIPHKDAASTKEEKKTDAHPTEDDDDDWGAVPAFLRRSKLK